MGIKGNELGSEYFKIKCNDVTYQVLFYKCNFKEKWQVTRRWKGGIASDDRCPGCFYFRVRKS